MEKLEKPKQDKDPVRVVLLLIYLVAAIGLLVAYASYRLIANIETIEPEPSNGTAGITPEQWADLQKRCKALGRNPLDILKLYGVNKGGDLPASAYEEMLAEFN